MNMNWRFKVKISLLNQIVKSLIILPSLRSFLYGFRWRRRWLRLRWKSLSSLEKLRDSYKSLKIGFFTCWGLSRIKWALCPSIATVTVGVVPRHRLSLAVVCRRVLRRVARVGVGRWETVHEWCLLIRMSTHRIRDLQSVTQRTITSIACFTLLGRNCLRKGESELLLLRIVS